MSEVPYRDTPSQKTDDIEQGMGRGQRISFMINLSDLWRKFKKWREGKNEKVDSSSDGSDDAGIDGDELRR